MQIYIFPRLAEPLFLCLAEQQALVRRLIFIGHKQDGIDGSLLAVVLPALVYAFVRSSTTDVQ